MDYPDGFKELVALVKKEPVAKAEGKDIWTAFCRAALIGPGRSDAEISFLLAMLKKQLDYDYVLKTDGETFQAELKAFLSSRLERIRDDDITAAVSSLVEGSFYLTATLKGGARFFEKKNIFEKLQELTAGKEKTKQFIDGLAEDGDVSGIKHAKAILWLQYAGRAQDFAPPTRQLKSFLNSDIGPYYSFYEDNEYFMKRAEEMGKDFSGTALADVYRAIFFYRSLKAALPRGSKFTPKKLVQFMKKDKFTVKKLSSALADMEKREALYKKLYKFMGYSV